MFTSITDGPVGLWERRLVILVSVVVVEGTIVQHLEAEGTLLFLVKAWRIRTGMIQQLVNQGLFFGNIELAHLATGPVFVVSKMTCMFLRHVSVQ